MSSDPFTLAFDSASLQRILRMAGFEVALEPKLEAEMHYIVELLQAESQIYMWVKFNQPTGPLEESIEIDVPDAYTGIVYSESPYAWRREEGFSGKTDSLGRYYAKDPGIHFFARTLRPNRGLIRSLLKSAVAQALVEMGGI
jgi:hypothetical protein